MDRTEELHKRSESLKARIEAARAHLAADQSEKSVEIGHLLESLSRDIEASHDAPHEERATVYDRVAQDVESAFTRITAERSVE